MICLPAGFTQHQSTASAELPGQPPTAGSTHEHPDGLTELSCVNNLQHRQVVGQLGQAGDASNLAAKGTADTIDATGQELLQTLAADGMATVQQLGPQLLFSERLHADGAF